MRYGYARVSAKDQNEKRQVVAIEREGVDIIYMDKQSGAGFNRPQYLIMLKKIKAGDVLIIKSIDRLGRDYIGIQEQWKNIIRKGVDIIVIDMPLLNTTVNNEVGLTGKFISDLVLQILAYVAETERTFIKQRQKEGIMIAKEKGIKFGRPRKEIPRDFSKVSDWYKNNYITSRQAAEKLGLSQTTFLRMLKQEEKN